MSKKLDPAACVWKETVYRDQMLGADLQMMGWRKVAFQYPHDMGLPFAVTQQMIDEVRASGDDHIGFIFGGPPAVGATQTFPESFYAFWARSADYPGNILMSSEFDRAATYHNAHVYHLVCPTGDVIVPIPPSPWSHDPGNQRKLLVGAGVGVLVVGGLAWLSSRRKKRRK